MEIEKPFFNTSDFEQQPKELGKGSYGTVYLVKNIKNNKNYAAKVCNIQENFDGNEQVLFSNESMTFCNLFHPSIVKFYGIDIKSLIDPSIHEPTIITEYLSNGSLRTNIDKEKKSDSEIKLTPTKKYIILLGISDAMRYLHEKGIIHRNLKPENILIDSDYYPHVSDYYKSRLFPNLLTNSLKKGQINTPIYIAPETLRFYDCYDSSVDVYSFSMIAYEIITGKVPFIEQEGESISPKKIIEGHRPKFTENVTEKMKNLLLKCWSNDPSKRPTFGEIFDHLSSDMTYLNETVDEEEIQKYLKMLSSSNKSKEKNSDLNIKLEEIISKLKEILKESSESDGLMYSVSISILEEKKYHNIKQAVNDLIILSDQDNIFCSFLLGFIYENELNMNESFKYYKKSFKDRNTCGIFRIGRCYDLEIGVKQDYIKAKKYYEQAAELGNSRAFSNLGLLYGNGQGVKKDYNKAKEYYEQAAELGDSYAFYNLGLLYENGFGVKKDYNKAKEYYERAAELGDSYAFYNLGLLYENGQGVEQDYNKAIEYFEKAAKLGNSNSMLSLGFLYANGQEVKQDYNKAIEYFERAVKFGNLGAMFNLGLLYADGRGVKQDYNKAKEYYEQAAKLGDSYSILNLGCLYENGLGVKQDYNKAKELYEQAQKLGDSCSLLNLGLLYANGQGVKQDYNKAKEYYEQAAKFGDSNAILNLGLLYANGQGVKQDYNKAIKYYEQAAELGCSKAMVRLGNLYTSNKEVKQDYNKAKEYFEKAAELGNSIAMYNLGFIYKFGKGVSKDYMKAKNYYEQAAKLGNSKSMLILGIMYEKGQGVRQNYHIAKEYYEKAINFGNQNANAKLRALYNNGFLPIVQSSHLDIHK